FKSKNQRVRSFAVEFMGLLGGRSTVAPLANVIRHDPSPDIRIQALRWLAEQLPSELPAKVIREAAKSNTDERTRQAAKNVLYTGSVYGAPAVSVPFKRESPKP